MMNFNEARNELRRMKLKDLFQLASMEKMALCLVGVKACSFYFRYKKFYFCLSEILGNSCPYEKAEEIEMKLSEFKVYYRDVVSRSIVFVGKILERRRKERGNNLRDLLSKAQMDFSQFVNDPSLLFLIGP